MPISYWQTEAPLTEAPADPSHENTAAASGVAEAGLLAVFESENPSTSIRRPEPEI